MTDPGRSGKGNAREASRAVEEDDYYRGFEEGTRSAFKEILSYVSKGHTASEIRLLTETRLTHLAEDAKEQQRVLLESPVSIPLENLIPRIRAESVSSSPPALPPLMPGHSYLFLEEEKPVRARSLVTNMLSKGVPSIVITRFPQGFGDSKAEGGPFVVVVGSSGGEGEEGNFTGVRHMEGDIPGLSSLIVRYFENKGKQVGCYFEAFEYYCTELGFDQTIKFVHWLNTMAMKNGGMLVLGVDPETLSKNQLRSLKADFSIITG